jgi:coniferyl-aldehyde dehydrogenase
VLLPEDVAPRFVLLFEQEVRRLYPRLLDNPDYCSVVNQRHYDRLEALIDDARAKGADVVEINPADEEFRSQLAHKLPPTLISRVTDEMKVMQDEIFGPVLPIRTYRSLEEAIAYINDRPRPLALYYFGNQKERRRAVLTGTTSGGVTVNDILLHYLQEDLPFGGVGASGMGAYHGREGFRTFSHRKAVFDQSRINTGDLLRPPYGKRVERIIKLLLR